MRKIYALFFLSVIIFFMCLVCYSYADKKIQDFNNPPKDAALVKIEWEKLYPFPENVIHPKANLPLEKIYKHVKERFENYTSDALKGRQKIVEAAMKYEALIGWNMTTITEYNPVIKLQDGYLSGVVESADVSKSLRSTIELAEWCGEMGIQFFYVNLPTKICISEDKNISGIFDFSNQNTDRFLRGLEAHNVKYIDLRKELHNDGMNHHEAFFRTDHHWKPESGLWGAKHILEFLRDNYGWNVKPEILNPENFDGVIYPEWFLGSQGKKVTLARTKPDDITLLYPKYNTNLRIEIPDKNINLSGDFSVTYNMSKVEVKDLEKLSPYGAYNYGRNTICRLENLIADNDKKFMLIYDSFSDSVIPFLALSIKNVYAADLRQFTGSLKAYIRSIMPDALTVIYYSEFPGQPILLPRDEYNTKLYDFR